MGDVQNKVLDMIRETAEEHGFEMLLQARYANTGSIYIQKPGSFSNALSIAYDFQTDYCSFNMYPPGREPIGGMIDEGERGCIKHIYAKYSSSQQMNEIVSFIDEWLSDIE